MKPFDLKSLDLDPQRRRELIEELVGSFTRGLSQLNTDQLEAVFDAVKREALQMGEQGGAGSGIGQKPTPMRGLRLTNDKAMLMVHPTTSKDELLTGVRQLLHWIDENWEKLPPQKKAESNAINVREFIKPSVLTNFSAAKNSSRLPN